MSGLAYYATNANCIMKVFQNNIAQTSPKFIIYINSPKLNPLSARKMTSFGVRLSEATQLHNGAIAHLALKGLN